LQVRAGVSQLFTSCTQKTHFDIAGLEQVISQQIDIPSARICMFIISLERTALLKASAANIAWVEPSVYRYHISIP
jgi:hypothetical protein